MGDGALMELVSRGKKDAYQIQDPVHSWFGSPYVRRSPSTHEIRLLYPENPPKFGQQFDIVLPSDGDILVSMELRIQMPTWLPPSIAAINNSRKVSIDSGPIPVKAYPYLGSPPTPFVPYDTSGQLQYGWCDGVANYMIGRWVLYVDNIAILDGYGEFNTWFPDMDTTQFHAPLIHEATGRNDGSPNAIQTNATLPELSFRIPLPGCQERGEQGLPLCAFRNQRIYIRFTLLERNQLATSAAFTPYPLPAAPVGSEAILLPCYDPCPTPWGGRQIYVDNVLQPGVVTLSATKMGQPYIYARTAILNVENELRASLAAQKFEIRFRQQQRDFWTVDTFVPGVNNRRLLQINGLFQALFLDFRSLARTKQNRYTDLLPSYGEWLSLLSLNINGQDRIYPWSPTVLTTLANATQLDRDINVALYYLIFGISPEDEPGGTCNMSRCQKAVLNWTFNNVQIDPLIGVNTTYASIIGMAWNILDIKNGIAMLRFPD